MGGEELFSNLLTVTILFTLLVIVYAKMANKTLVEIIRDIREAFSSKTDDIVEYAPQGFDDIR